MCLFKCTVCCHCHKCHCSCVSLSLFLSLFETAKFGKFGSKDDGSGFKAALLSGPPGVGKTTTAALVCEVSSVSLINTYSITFSLTVFQKQSV